MSEYAGAFDKIFLERTKIIIDKTSTEYEFTLLLNCTLALICQPLEKLNKNENFEIIDLIGNELRKNQKLNGTNSQILRCLRNGIAHLNIKVIDTNNKFDKINIKGSTNSYKINNKFLFSYNDLKLFSLKCIEIYLGYSK